MTPGFARRRRFLAEDLASAVGGIPTQVGIFGFVRLNNWVTEAKLRNKIGHIVTSGQDLINLPPRAISDLSIISWAMVFDERIWLCLSFLQPIGVGLALDTRCLKPKSSAVPLTYSFGCSHRETWGALSGLLMVFS
jgi:hypothetical protein